MSRNEGILAGGWCPYPPLFPFFSLSFCLMTLLFSAYLAYMILLTAVKPSLRPCLTSSRIMELLAILGNSTRLLLRMSKFSHNKCSKSGIKSSLESATRYILWKSRSTRSFEPCCLFKVTSCWATVKLGRLSACGNLRKRVVKEESRCLWARFTKD